MKHETCTYRRRFIIGLFFFLYKMRGIGACNGIITFPTSSLSKPQFCYSTSISCISSQQRIQFLKATHLHLQRFSKADAAPQNLSETTENDYSVQLSQDRVEEEKQSKFSWESQWYPVAIAAHLDKRIPRPFKILGYDLVAWWDGVGSQWQVFEDKCPHRLAPLSEGRIAENGHLQCSYHGWTFAPNTGACSRIPQARSDGPQVQNSPRACAVAYKSIEQQGILWVWLNRNDIENSMAKLPPYFPMLDDPRFSDTWGMRDMFYGYEILTENVLDPSHVPWAHHNLQGDRKKAGPLNLIADEMDMSGFKGSIFNMNIIFKPPCAVIYEGAGFVLLCVPVSPGKSRLFWAFQRYETWLGRFTPRWMEHLLRLLVLDSDLYFLHILEHRLKDWKSEYYIPTKADNLVRLFRRWLENFAGGSPWDERYDRRLPPSPPKEQLMDRFSSHVQYCPHCTRALNVFKGLQLGFQLVTFTLLGLVMISARKPSAFNNAASMFILLLALSSWIASKWMSQFIRKRYYFHDYNHALR